VVGVVIGDHYGPALEASTSVGTTCTSLDTGVITQPVPSYRPIPSASSAPPVGIPPRFASPLFCPGPSLAGYGFIVVGGYRVLMGRSPEASTEQGASMRRILVAIAAVALFVFVPLAVFAGVSIALERH
jgi:hypothetical protein